MNQINGKYCRDCGQIISRTAPTCPQCGGQQGGVALSGTNHKSRIAAALLAFFLGGIGIHKFYLGQPGRGILYFLFFWTLIPCILAFIEMIIFLCMSDEDFSAKYDR